MTENGIRIDHQNYYNNDIFSQSQKIKKLKKNIMTYKNKQVTDVLKCEVKT